jgi:hypothetical protein
MQPRNMCGPSALLTHQNIQPRNMCGPFALLTHQNIQPRNMCDSSALQVFGLICISGVFDNVLSDYLWARAVVLTTPTIATVGLSLTIPLAFLSDALFHGLLLTLLLISCASLLDSFFWTSLIFFVFFYFFYYYHYYY